FEALGQSMPDGSILLPTSQARRAIETMLSRQGYARAAIDDAVARFDAAPENTLMPLTEDIAMANWRTERVELLLDGTFVSDLLPLKIAYEFVVLHLPYSVWADPPLEEVRLALRGEGACTDTWNIEA